MGIEQQGAESGRSDGTSEGRELATARRGRAAGGKLSASQASLGAISGGRWKSTTAQELRAAVEPGLRRGISAGDAETGEEPLPSRAQPALRPCCGKCRLSSAEADVTQLDQVFWLEEERVVSEDWVVRYNNRLLQLERQSQHWAPSRSRVLVRENEAGKIQIRYRDHDLLFHEVPWASTARSKRRGLECTLGLRHEVKGAVAVC
jgi:hypothetical protein